MTAHPELPCGTRAFRINWNWDYTTVVHPRTTTCSTARPQYGGAPPALHQSPSASHGAQCGCYSTVCGTFADRQVPLVLAREGGWFSGQWSRSRRNRRPSASHRHDRPNTSVLCTYAWFHRLSWEQMARLTGPLLFREMFFHSRRWSWCRNPMFAFHCFSVS